MFLMDSKGILSNGDVINMFITERKIVLSIILNIKFIINYPFL